MQVRALTDGPPRVWAAVFEQGEDLLGAFEDWVEQSGLGAASLSGVGGFSEATLGYYDVDAQRYVDIPVAEQVEVLVLAGDVTCKGEEHQVHAHVVCGRRDGSAVGGHILRAVVRPTLELVVTETPAHLQRRHDEASGLALIDLG